MSISMNIISIGLPGSEEVVHQTVERLEWPRTTEDGIPLGIDIEAKRNDIIKIVHKFFKVKDMSMDELLQEVYLAIIHKNRTNSAHNPSKSSFGHYVYMIANNVCINIVHKMNKYGIENESIDEPIGPDGKNTIMDTLESDEDTGEIELLAHMEQVEDLLRKYNKWEEARYVRSVSSGAPNSVIREALSYGDKVITKKDIRDIRCRINQFVKQYIASNSL